MALQRKELTSLYTHIHTRTHTPIHTETCPLG